VEAFPFLHGFGIDIYVHVLRFIMGKIYLLLLLVLLVTTAFLLFTVFFHDKETTVREDNNPEDSIGNPEEVKSPDAESDNGFIAPLDGVRERASKKKFGMYITPQNSPVQPERFTGYHTGVDFEIFPEELNKEVAVYAICSGKLLLKQFGSGYGGYAVQACELDGEPITVTYGHLKPPSIHAGIGEALIAGGVIGILGAHQSAETDGERKHLHLGIHIGTAINSRGYVGSESEILQWIDPCLYVCGFSE